MKKWTIMFFTVLFLFAAVGCAQEYYTIDQLREQAAEGWHNVYEAYGRKMEESRISDATEEAGYGVKIFLDGAEILAGNSKMMARANIAYQKEPGAKTVIHVAKNGIYAGLYNLAGV